MKIRSASEIPWKDLQSNGPLIVAVAGSNGSGKSTFYGIHLGQLGLPFLNADIFAKELGVSSYVAAEILAALRKDFVDSQQSFVFETVFSDPVGDKLEFLSSAVKAGFQVVLLFIAIPNVSVSDERVAMRVAQGGHDVPLEKLRSRFPRTAANLRKAIAQLPLVVVFNNADLAGLFPVQAVYQNGTAIYSANNMPNWLKRLLNGES